jgi:hypothetical protein
MIRPPPDPEMRRAGVGSASPVSHSSVFSEQSTTSTTALENQVRHLRWNFNFNLETAVTVAHLAFPRGAK